MKTFLLFLISTSISLSQPILNNMEDFEIGDKNIYFESFDPIEIQTGENLIWDYSNLNYNPSSTYKQEIIANDDPQFKTAFPNSTIIESYKNNYIFLHKDENGIYSEGNSDPEGEFKRPYNSLITNFLKPMTYLDSIESETDVQYQGAGFDYSGITTQKVICDGYGKLILPNGEHQDVLKFKFENYSLDTLTAFGMEIKVEAIAHVWFNASNSSPLMRVEEYTLTSDSFNDYDYRISFIDKNITSIENELPNISNTYLNGLLKFESKIQNLEIYNLEGRLIASLGNGKEFDLSTLKDYKIVFVRYNANNNLESIKLSL